MKVPQSMVAELSAASRFARLAWRDKLGWRVFIVGVFWALALVFPERPQWPAFAVAASLVASASLYRQAVSGRAGGLFAACVRLAAVWLLSLAFFAVLAALLLVVFLASAYAVASAGVGFDPAQVRTWAPAIDDRGRVVLGLIAAFGLSLLGWAMSRIALASAATSASGRIQVLTTWPLTRGQGWRLLLQRLLIAAPVLILAPLALHAARSAFGPGAWMLGAAAGAAIGALWLPLNCGLMAYIYSRRPDTGLEPAAPP